MKRQPVLFRPISFPSIGRNGNGVSPVPSVIVDPEPEDTSTAEAQEPPTRIKTHVAKRLISRVPSHPDIPLAPEVKRIPIVMR